VRDLSKTKLKKLSEELEAAQEVFQHHVEVLAEKARAAILPYFKKHNYDFGAVNGYWFISRPAADAAPYYRPDDYVKHDDLPPHILALLRLEVRNNIRLGDHIRPIKRGEW
jgi:hypothetical protein